MTLSKGLNKYYYFGFSFNAIRIEKYEISYIFIVISLNFLHMSEVEKNLYVICLASKEVIKKSRVQMK